MAEMTKTKIVGLVENMSYVKCPDCGKEIKIYQDSQTEEVAAKHGLVISGRLPLDVELANLSDSGNIEAYSENYIDELIKDIEEL